MNIQFALSKIIKTFKWDLILYSTYISILNLIYRNQEETISSFKGCNLLMRVYTWRMVRLLWIKIQWHNIGKWCSWFTKTCSKHNFGDDLFCVKPSLDNFVAFYFLFSWCIWIVEDPIKKIHKWFIFAFISTQESRQNDLVWSIVVCSIFRMTLLIIENLLHC